MKIEITTIVLNNPNDDIRMLKNALSSVLNQSVPVDEIIVVDCGYDDKIIEMIDEIQKEGNNVQYIAECEDDRMMRRVHGAKKAHHEWITFLNADEVWISDKIENQIKTIQSNRYRKDLLILVNWYDGSIYPDTPMIIDTVIGGPCQDMKDDKEALLMQYAPHMYSGMVLSRCLFMKAVESCNIINDEQVFLKLLEYGNTVYLPYTYYIHKIVKSPEYIGERLKPICDALILKKDIIVSSYGIAYWNDKIRQVFHEFLCITHKEDIIPLFLLFDFDKVNLGSVEEIDDIDKYVYKKEMERLMCFCNIHKDVGCYGAGEFGERILRFLQRAGKPIVSVIVSDAHKSQDDLHGIKIVECSDFDLDSLDGIIVAMNLNTFPEVMKELRRKYNGDIFTVTYSTMSLMQIELLNTDK